MNTFRRHFAIAVLALVATAGMVSGFVCFVTCGDGPTPADCLDHSVVVRTEAKCEACDGTGTKMLFGEVYDCPLCAGTGKVVEVK